MDEHSLFCKQINEGTEQAAESIVKAIAAFEVATRINFVISETEPMMFDVDRKRIVMPLIDARQHRFDTEPFVLLRGTRKQHTCIKAFVRASDAD